MEIMFEQAYSVVLEDKESYNLILVGCGGTGGYIAESLARFAWDLKQRGKRVELIFIDHDHVEQKNVGRQRFAPAEVGLNKALCLANRYNLAFGLDIVAVARPFCAEMMAEWGSRYTSGNTLLIGAVDNATARQQLAQAVTQGNGRLWCLDAGNALHNGNVYLGNLSSAEQLRLNDELMLMNGFPSPFLQNPTLLHPEKPRNEMQEESCAVRTQRREQSMVINLQMGALLARYLECWLVERKMSFMHTAVSLERPGMQTTLATGSNLEKWLFQERLQGE